MQEGMDAPGDEESARLAAWIERTVGGTVTRIDRMPRWRPAWDVDVEVDGRLLPLHARGEREARIAMPARIADEVAVHDLLETHGLPVPHAYGICDDPYALVMDRLSGLVDLAGATDITCYSSFGAFILPTRHPNDSSINCCICKTKKH